MIKVYGMPSCPDCAAVEKQIEGNPEFEYIDIGKDVHALRAFLSLRDSLPVFEELKRGGDVCIPCFVKEDGTVTLDPEEVGLSSEGGKPTKTACSLNGKGC